MTFVGLRFNLTTCKNAFQNRYKDHTLKRFDLLSKSRPTTQCTQCPMAWVDSITRPAYKAMALCLLIHRSQNTIVKVLKKISRVYIFLILGNRRSAEQAHNDDNTEHLGSNPGTCKPQRVSSELLIR